ncbi:hypothetical protein AB1Y20_001031 [Prymnesium parvum]|uniref:Cilia- and flagella-associated protein 157 n=1 Tax=Prymnesium parvum TaxID=97485 RepID=A0AB34KCD5_PRYPA
MDGASADGTPQSARSIRVKPHRVAAGTRTPWHSEWEAEKKDAKLQFKADFEKLVHDMHAALQQEARQLNEVTGERMAKEASLSRLTKQFEDGKDMSTKLLNDKERLSSRLQELEHDLAIVTEELDDELRDEMTREHMYNTLAAVRSCWERRRQDHASRVVEACEQLRDLKERHEVAAFMEQHVLHGLAQAKEALVRQRAKQEETKVAMKASS